MNTKLVDKIEVIKVTKPSSSSGIAQDSKEHIRCLLETILKELVSFPEDIRVNYSCGEKTTIYQVDCSKRVIGQVMGVKGKNILSVRTLIQSITSRMGFRSIVEIPYFEPREE